MLGDKLPLKRIDKLIVSSSDGNYPLPDHLIKKSDPAHENLYSQAILTGTQIVAYLTGLFLILALHRSAG